MDSFISKKLMHFRKILCKIKFNKFIFIILVLSILQLQVIQSCNAAIVWDIENNLNVRVNDHAFELIQANNLQRQEMVQHVCDSRNYTDAEDLLSNTPDDQMDHLLIDSKHKFLYCYVPKVKIVE